MNVRLLLSGGTEAMIYVKSRALTAAPSAVRWSAPSRSCDLAFSLVDGSDAAGVKQITDWARDLI